MNSGSKNGSRLYRVLFGEPTILLKGYLLLAGIALHLVGRYFEQAFLTQLGLWMTFPFIVTLLLVILVLIPWYGYKHWCSL